MQNAARREAPGPDVEAIREEAFRAGYGMGGDAYQHEHRHRPFLVEDEAWEEWRAVAP